MKFYGYKSITPGLYRCAYPDAGDNRYLGCQSRYGKLKARSRRATRRIFKKGERRRAKMFVESYLTDDHDHD